VIRRLSQIARALRNFLRFRDRPAAYQLADALLEPVMDRHSAVSHTPGVCRGVAVLAGTRIPVWRLSRLTVSEIRERYWYLTDQQIVDAHEYAADHPGEMARDIEENRGDEG
jgi:uncharacterized protein (DUF433 family)